jgi:hypothetical protein
MGSIVFHDIAFNRNASCTLGREYVLRFTSDGNLELWNEPAHRLVALEETIGVLSRHRFPPA